MYHVGKVVKGRNCALFLPPPVNNDFVISDLGQIYDKLYYECDTILLMDDMNINVTNDGYNNFTFLGLF